MRVWSFVKSIKFQLSVVLFILSAVAIGVVGFLGIRALLESAKTAEVTITEASRDRLQEFLTQSASAQAAKNSVIFQDLQRDAYNAAQYVGGLLDNPGQFPNNKWRFDANMTRLPGGQMGNSSADLSSVWVSNWASITPLFKRQIELTAYMDYYAPQFLKDEQNAVAIYYMGTQGESRYYPNVGLASFIPADYDPTKDVFFTSVTPSNNPSKEPRLSSVYDDPVGNGQMVTASSPIYSAEGTFLGMVGIDITLSRVAANIEAFSPVPDSYSFLIDRDGKGVALPKQAYQDILGRPPEVNEIGADLTQASGTYGEVLHEMREGNQGFKLISAAGGDLAVAYAPVEGTSFSLGMTVKQTALQAVVGQLRDQVGNEVRSVLFGQIIPTAAIALMAVWFVGYIYVRFVTAPISAMKVQAANIMTGKFEKTTVKEAAQGEIGELARAFNTMIDALSKSYADLHNKIAELGRVNAKDEAVLQSLGQGMLVTDEHGRVLLINDIATELMGVKKEDVIGHNLDSHTMLTAAGKPLPPAERPISLVLGGRKKVRMSVQTMRSAGVKVAVDVTATPVMLDGTIIGVVQIMHDITRDKEIERMKSEFITIASHQLRTPLSAIKWFGEMLASGDAGKLKPQQSEFAKNIVSSTYRMIELVNSLLNISRLDSGRILLSPRETNLKMLIDGVSAELKDVAEAHSIDLSITVDNNIPTMMIDPQLLSQVYLNLFTNALRYTPQGGTVRVTVSLKDDEVVTEVSDTGMGVPEVEQAKMFSKFFRGSNVAKIETDGTGLGLYLTKAIVESSGGRIWFKSEEGKGTTFWFTLPLQHKAVKEGEVSID